jgi:tungstate transport system ATP-binding protein
MKSPWIELRNVHVHLGAVAALTDVSLSIGSAERVALVGGNGAGKSSLLRLINGLLEPSHGILERSQAAQAMVFQRPHMLRQSVLDNVCLGLRLRGVEAATANERANEALMQVGLLELAQRNAKNLSGGQQQRVGIARALALAPQALLLDEPTANLDPHGKTEVEQLMQRLGAQGLALVFASHNLGQVKRLATRVICLERGHVLADMPAQDFFNPSLLRATSPAAAEFVQGEVW